MIRRIVAFTLILIVGMTTCFNMAQVEAKIQTNEYKQVESNDFYAYYTRISSEEEEIKNSGEYADIIVNVKDKGKLVFSRITSYRPAWLYDDDVELVEHLANIEGDGPTDLNFDRYSKYAYARIIENTEEEIIIHWRYFPNLNELSPTKVVHEIYTIHPDGSVIREFKKGTDTIDEWKDPNNKITETFKLTKKGISEPKRVKSKSKVSKEAVTGNPIKGSVIQKPITWIKFDEGIGNNVDDAATSKTYDISGHTSLWKKGVSGTALGFDGYFSKIEIPLKDTPKLSKAFTVDLWTVIGAYPFGPVPFVEQSNDLGKEGYFFGINEKGKIILRIEGEELESPKPLNLNTWHHATAAFGNGSMEIYIDGKKVASKDAPKEVFLAEVPLIMGLNRVPTEATDPVRENYETIIGLEGLMDEIKIYNLKLSDQEILKTYKSFNPGNSIIKNPDIEKRILPGHPGKADKFGATYKQLSFHDLWDNMWRADPYSDIVVKFDDKPTSYVYWRGTTHGVNMVTENNLWMSDQSVEVFCENQERENPSLSEHMSDKQARFSHVRVLENTDARVVIHWRYATGDLDYNICSPKSFVDEYHTIYPDGTLYRTQKYWAADTHEFRDGSVVGDLQPLTPAGKLPTDVVNHQALSVAKIDGEYADLVFNGSQFNNKLEGEILMANYKSDWKIFTAFNQGSGGPWGKEEQSPHSKNTFAGPWNHWPISQIISDGRYSHDGDGRINSFALSAGGGASSSMYGFSNQKSKAKQRITDVLPAVRSWMQSPKVKSISGGEYLGYNDKQKEYNFSLEKQSVSFKLKGRETSPIINPCFVIKNWNSNDKAILKIDSEEVSNFRQGVIRDIDGTQTLIVYVPMEAMKVKEIEIARSRAVEEIPNDEEDGLVTLKIEKIGTGRGAVFIETDSINGKFKKGTEVLLYAQASPGSSIAGWHGDIGNIIEEDNTVIMDSDKTIKVEFKTDSIPTVFKAKGNTDPDDQMEVIDPDYQTEGSYDDYIAVTFDTIPTKLKFTPPAAPIMATENNISYLNGWAETYDPEKDEGSFEPNMDGNNKHARMWIESQNDARIVVRWRAALMSKNGIVAHNDAPQVAPYGPGDWVDEWYTIYPDGTYVRKSKIWTHYAEASKPFGGDREPPNYVHEFQEIIINSSDPRRVPYYPEEDIHTKALTLIKMDGRSKEISYDPYPVKHEADVEEFLSAFGEFTYSNIFVVNTKSKYRPFTIGRTKGVTITPYGPEVEKLPRIFQSWPTEIAPDGAYHAASLGHIINQDYYNRTDETLTQVYLSGWTDSSTPEKELVPLAKSWLSAPELCLDKESDAKTYGYDLAERAYLLDATSVSKNESIEFNIEASKDKPLVNPAFLIKNWHDDAIIKVDGKVLKKEDGVRMGFYKLLEMENKEPWDDTLIVYLDMDSDAPIHISIQPID